MAALAAAAPIFQGIMGFAQGNYQAQVANMNAKVATWNAVQTQQKAQIEQQNQDAKSAGRIGELVAQQGASGVSLGSGSAVMTRSAAAMLGRRDALNIRNAGDIEAHNYLVDASNFKSQASLDQFGGVTSLIGGFLGGASTLVGGASKTPGVFDWMSTAAAA